MLLTFLFSLFYRKQNIEKFSYQCNYKPQPYTCLSKCIVDYTSLKPESSNTQHSGEYNANCHCNMNLSVTKQPIQNPDPKIIQVAPNHQYLKRSLTTVNCTGISCNHDFKKSQRSDSSNRHYLTRNLTISGPKPPPRKFCSCSLKKPHVIISNENNTFFKVKKYLHAFPK